MPRGRPPLSRTKEEALTTRREQVRKNVQAFRRRKQEQHTESEDGDTVKTEGYTFVLENRSRAQANNSSRAEGVCQHTRSVSLRSLKAHCDYLSSISSALPLEIRSANLSLQQLVAAATSFSPSQPTWMVGQHWTKTLPLLTNIHSTLDLSLPALCLLQIGHVYSQRWLLNQSISFYDRALKALQVTLADPRNGKVGTHGFRMEIFAAAMTLAAYELLSQSNGDKRGRGWMAHIEGAVIYLNLFPGLDVLAFCHQLSFHFLETICIFDALGARKPNCFSNSKWWRTNVDCLSDESYGALLRMVTTLPSVVEKVDEAIERGVGEVCEWMDLLGLCERFEAAFLDWFERSITQNLARQTWIGTDIATYGLVDPARPDPDPNIEFPILYIARLYLLYWCCMILLYECLITVHRHLKLDAVDALSTPPLHATSLLHYTTIAHAFALKTRYSVQYCLRPEHGVVGRCVIMLPLWIATNHLRSCGDTEATWCDGVLEELGMKDISFGLKVKKVL